MDFFTDGTIDKSKARLVAQGFSQQHNIDYSQVYCIQTFWFIHKRLC